MDLTNFIVLQLNENKVNKVISHLVTELNTTKEKFKHDLIENISLYETEDLNNFKDRIIAIDKYLRKLSSIEGMANINMDELAQIIDYRDFRGQKLKKAIKEIL